MRLFARLQARQVLEVLIRVGQGQFIIQVGAVTDEQHLGTPALTFQEAAQAGHVVLHRRHIGRPAGVDRIVRRDRAIGAGRGAQLDLLLAAGCVVGKAVVHQLAVGIGAVGDQGRQIIEQEAQVNVEPPQRLAHDVQPDIALVAGDGVQGAPQAIVVELGGRDAEHRHQHGLRQPVRHLVQRSGRHQPVEHQDHDHGAMIHLGRLGQWRLMIRRTSRISSSR